MGRAPRQSALVALVLLVSAVIVMSVFWAGSVGVRSAGSAARLPIPSTRTVHLQAKRYMVSFASYHSSSPGLQVPDLELSITGTQTDEDLQLRRPTKRYFSVSGAEKVQEQYLIDVPSAGSYDVRVSADAPTDGVLLIGDRPINALRRLFWFWLVVIAIGGLSSLVAAIAVLARRGRLSINVTA